MERECLGIVWGIKKFALYLYVKQFMLQTDHRPLEFLKVSQFYNPRIMRWVLALQSFVFRVEHIQGKDNVGADFLSRVPVKYFEYLLLNVMFRLHCWHCCEVGNF